MDVVPCRSGSSMRDIDFPSKRQKAPSIPTHRPPSDRRAREPITRLRKSSSGGFGGGRKSTPSKRNNPCAIPIQRLPSRSTARVLTVLAGNPLSRFHVRTLLCWMLRSGLSADSSELPIARHSRMSLRIIQPEPIPKRRAVLGLIGCLFTIRVQIYLTGE